MYFTLKYVIHSSELITHLGRYWNVGIGKRNRSFNSVNWKIRRNADRYIEFTIKQKYRCRSAFKLKEINEKFGLVKPGFKVLDLGAAPGSWSQLLADTTNSNKKDSRNPVGVVVAVDLNYIHPIDGVITVSNSDFTVESTQKKIFKILGENEKFDFIFSDIAPQATGMKFLDREKLINIIYPVLLFSIKHLKKDGGCLIKMWNGAEQSALVDEVNKFFSLIKFVKPDASYQSSSECYLLLRNFLGLKEEPQL